MTHEDRKVPNTSHETYQSNIFSGLRDESPLNTPRSSLSSILFSRGISHGLCTYVLAYLPLPSPTLPGKTQGTPITSPTGVPYLGRKSLDYESTVRGRGVCKLRVLTRTFPVVVRVLCVRTCLTFGRPY